jgi:hydrogenase/urease accessory protein HupE
MMFWRFTAFLWLIALASTAHAHMLPKQTATMNILDKAAFFVVSVPVSALSGVDDEGNGLLSATEMQKHTPDIVRQFAKRFKVADADNAASPSLSWVMPPQSDGPPIDTDYVIVLHRVDFANAPKNPTLETDLFGTKGGENQMTITATRNNKTESEVAILEASAPSHKFFRGGFATFIDFVRIGVEHILGGMDHLLFLLTIIIAAAGWRYWLGVVTSFTIAHSITLTLSALNIVRIPANIVEPGIALSIVIAALLNLRTRSDNAVGKGWARIAIVFACGLLHGFGFASAIGAIAVDTGSRVATLAGFNVGIEIGQFLFVSAVLFAIALFKRMGRIEIANQLPRFASFAAAGLGLFLFSQRLGIV